jgi:hypothetical protein
MSDRLDEVFDVIPVEVVGTDGKTTVIPPEGDEDEDHEYARARHYELAQRGAEALEIAMKIARETESTKAIDSLSLLIRSLSEINKNLLNLNKDKAEAKTAKGTTSAAKGTVNQNIIFTGSSKELNKLISDQLGVTKQ